MEFNALILAGGGATRMGQPKHQLRYQSKTFLEHVQNTLEKLSPKQMYISGSGIKGAIPDIIENIGPLAGIHAVLQQSRLSLLVVAVDAPLISAQHLNSLVEEGLSNRVSTFYKGSPIPCFLHQDSRCTEVIDSMIAKHTRAKELALYSLCQNLQATTIADHDVDLSNINTPEDYKRLLAADD